MFLECGKNTSNRIINEHQKTPNLLFRKLYVENYILILNVEKLTGPTYRRVTINTSLCIFHHKPLHNI